ncbi:MAG TPA: hypothetical protein VLY45_04500 [Nitrospiria bacterium]|nr:hypothetical protein [Nitrospiria bacterium]
MMTIFSIPKPCAGHIGVIQRNAVRSWSRLRPQCQIILLGDETGIKELADECRGDWIPAIARNQYGTPLLDSAFARAMASAHFDRLCYINADIILMDDFLPAVRRIGYSRYLMAGRRWDVTLSEAWDYDSDNADVRLRQYVERHGTMHPPSGSDYFVFPRRAWFEEFPPFAVGRPGWDNWVIYAARKRGIPVIDATGAATVIHQNHDYQHVPARSSGVWEGPEADRNRELVGGGSCLFTLADATHILTPRTLHRALDREHLRRYWVTLPILVPAIRPVIGALRRIATWCGVGAAT